MEAFCEEEALAHRDIAVIRCMVVPPRVAVIDANIVDVRVAKESR